MVDAKVLERERARGKRQWAKIEQAVAGVKADEQEIKQLNAKNEELNAEKTALEKKLQQIQARKETSSA